MKKALSVIFILTLIFPLTACGNTKKTEYSFFGMDTLISVSLYEDNKKLCEETEKEIENTVKEYEKIFSATDESSEVFRFNNRKSDVFNCSRIFADILKTAEESYKITNGAFDITVMPVLKEWGFDNGNYCAAKPEKIKKALLKTGFDNIKLNGNTVSAKDGTEISLGGIAKGYTGDILIKKLSEKNINAVISLGGNIITTGTRPDGEKWNIAVKNPEKDNENLCTIKTDSEKSIVTSGSYERYFEFEGKKYHHIINPENGYPTDNGILSVTVIGNNGALCDALSTGLFVAGVKESAEIMKNLNTFDYIILTNDKKIYSSLSADEINIISDEYTLVTQ